MVLSGLVSFFCGEAFLNSAFSSYVKIGAHRMPSIWQYMLPEDFFHLHFPSEQMSDCARCPQVVEHGFREPHKCCTYIPRIPNFLLGGALMHGAKVQNGITTFGLPEGSLITPAYYEDSLMEAKRGLFGKSDLVQCPFLSVESGRCQIYAFRNSVCSTFFCRNNHGTRGHMFWEKVQNLVGQIETALSHFCMEELSLPVDNYIKTLDTMAAHIGDLSDAKTKGWTRQVQKKLFGPYADREESFYLECYKIIVKNKDRLFEIAESVPLKDTWKYHRALYDWFSKEAQEEVVFAPPKGEGRIVSISDLWYELKLFHRDLWRLPFNEGSLLLNPKVVLAENKGDSAIRSHFGCKPFRLSIMGNAKVEWETYLTEKEYHALSFFKQTRKLDSRLLENSAIKALDDPRASLSYWIRLKALDVEKEF